jgi:NAD(P)-dependent dehydrogenase (short-subunit alcohol dehydrogenase family)
MDLKGKTIVLTGAKRIGQTVAEELAKKGANLAITFRSSKEEAEAMCAACLSHGITAKTFQADLSKEEDIKRMVVEVRAEFGSIDGLVHMAANYPKVPLDEVTLENFLQTQEIIAGSAVLLAKYLKEDAKKMIFFSDWSILVSPYPDYLSYNMAKAGIDSLVKALAKQLAPDVTVNAIAPGPILRPPDLSEEENTEALSGTPLNRWGGAEEIAKAVMYLMDSDFVTGVILPVDGGRSIS